MLVGVPKEIKKQEARVGLTPAAVREYVAHGHEVLVETGAGEGIGADDAAYEQAGATIAATAEDVFAKAGMIVKVKEPQPSEWAQLREGQILFTYLHLAPDPEQTHGLLESGVTSVAYETVTEGNGLPLLAPMSEVAGRLSIEAAAIASRSYNGGNGLLMGGVPGVAPARVVVLGGGVVGTHAARMAVGLGADVSIMDRSLPRLRQLDELFEGRARTRFSTIDAIEEEIVAADVVIGSVLVPGASAPKLITRDMLGLMKPRTVLVDVAIDQGGCFETSHATTHAEPTYEVDGIIHYCIANMPGSVPRTSSHALNNATLPYGLALADGGLAAILENPGLRAGLSTHRGKLTSMPVAESLGLDFTAANDAIAA
ncbi:alanine dehydrogenase [Croceicoccus bisphenolivorans]|uniref:alanine dehydrogenase n=1 Tax=Croceicoccus bisphenolivorans TaxID=1783232 RepID=UPI0008364889|nr:alanine dehydrogenase [Croceicoccus bisphenolivorans]